MLSVSSFKSKFTFQLYRNWRIRKLNNYYFELASNWNLLLENFYCILILIYPELAKILPKTFFPPPNSKAWKTQRNMASIFRPELMYIKRLLQKTFKYRMQTIELHCRNQLKLPRDRKEETKENAQRSATAKALSCFSDYWVNYTWI